MPTETYSRIYVPRCARTQNETVIQPCPRCWAGWESVVYLHHSAGLRITTEQAWQCWTNMSDEEQDSTLRLAMMFIGKRELN